MKYRCILYLKQGSGRIYRIDDYITWETYNAMAWYDQRHFEEIDMSPYDRWQMERHGNILPDGQPEEDQHNVAAAYQYQNQMEDYFLNQPE